MDKFEINSERLFRISAQLGDGSGDLTNCLAPDLKHLCEILARLCVLQDLAPGFVDDMFDNMIPHFIKSHNRAIVAQVAQKRVNDAGFGDEWKAVIEAGRTPNQKDYLAKLVTLQMKANGVNQAQAINEIARQSSRDPDNLRRVVTRSKKRNK